MKKIIDFIKKTFGSLDSSISHVLLAHYLTKVAKCQSYVETFCRHADTLHCWIKRIYDEDISRAFEIRVRQALRHLNVRSAGIAIDFTNEPFYGKSRNLHTINVSKRESYNAVFKYVTCCLITKNKQIPLMALPVSYGQQVSQTLDLLRFCMSLNFRIKYVLFDRGFYTAELIDFLQSKKLRYLMLVPVRDGTTKSYKDKTSVFAKYNHQLHYAKSKSSWKPTTKLVVCKNQFGYDWMFATNIELDNPRD